MLRVRVTEKMSVYWNHQLLHLAADDEVEGEAAIYLARTGAPVEIVEGELPPEPDTEPADGEQEPTGGPHLVPGSTIAEITAWVNDDPGRAKAALAAEQEREKPRATLVAKLEPLAAQADEDGSGEPGDEQPPGEDDQTGNGGE
jgi:hypothetical protein